MSILNSIVRKEVRKYTKFSDHQRIRWIVYTYKIFGIPVYVQRMRWN